MECLSKKLLQHFVDVSVPKYSGFSSIHSLKYLSGLYLFISSSVKRFPRKNSENVIMFSVL